MYSGSDIAQSPPRVLRQKAGVFENFAKQKRTNKEKDTAENENIQVI